MRANPRSKASSIRLNVRTLTVQNIRAARQNWALSNNQATLLKTLTCEFKLSVAIGDLKLINGGWYVTHSGLMRLARRNRCIAIAVKPVREFCDPASCRWVFKATVYKSTRSRGFVGYGDADPSNVSSVVHGAEMRVAETRAVNRALRKAYGIGLCSVEELGWALRQCKPDVASQNGSASPGSGTNGRHNGQPRLRDRLCLLIRQHSLDATLVKAYAADYCGTPTLREASRESVEAFIKDLAERAAKDRDGLLCHLNSYAKSTEVSQ
jgi:hypothetical protein